jgi:hypothetical protein
VEVEVKVEVKVEVEVEVEVQVGRTVHLVVQRCSSRTLAIADVVGEWNSI